jgi:hypothetical protein
LGLGIAKKDPIAFLDASPDSNSHSLRWRTDKTLIGNIIGKRLPDIRDKYLSSEDKDIYYQTILTLYQPFRLSLPGQEEIQDWEEEFEAWLPIASVRAKRYMSHCEDYYVAREMQLELPDEEYLEYQDKMAAENEGNEPDVEYRNFEDQGLEKRLDLTTQRTMWTIAMNGTLTMKLIRSLRLS